MDFSQNRELWRAQPPRHAGLSRALCGSQPRRLLGAGCTCLSPESHTVPGTRQAHSKLKWKDLFTSQSLPYKWEPREGKGQFSSTLPSWCLRQCLAYNTLPGNVCEMKDPHLQLTVPGLDLIGKYCDICHSHKAGFLKSSSTIYSCGYSLGMNTVKHYMKLKKKKNGKITRNFNTYFSLGVFSSSLQSWACFWSL